MLLFQAQFPLHKPLVDFHGTKLKPAGTLFSNGQLCGQQQQHQKHALETRGFWAPVAQQLQLAVQQSAAPIAGQPPAAQAQAEKPLVGPTLAKLASGAPIVFPQRQMYAAAHLRGGFTAVAISFVNKQPPTAHTLHRLIHVQGVPCQSTESGSGRSPSTLSTGRSRKRSPCCTCRAERPSP